MAGLDTSLVNVGLNTIATDLHASLTSVQWITSGYLLALAAALPAVPWLQDRFGASRLWLVSLLTFTAASVLCAVAPTLAVLILARALQGVSGGLLVPTGQNIVLRAIRPERMGRIMSTAGLALVLAPAIGPALGGLLIDTTSWRLLFLVNLPIGAAALILGLRVLPKDSPDGTATLDVGGLLLLSTGLPAISLGLTDLGSSRRPEASPTPAVAPSSAISAAHGQVGKGSLTQPKGGRAISRARASPGMGRDGQRKRRKNPRTCSTSDSGCSSAAKWPPRGSSSNQRRSVNRSSASRREGRVISRG
jgi:MFS family permease